MRVSLILVVFFLITAPALLVLAQVNRVDTFERGFRPHPAQSKMGMSSLSQMHQPPTPRLFYINRVGYKAAISGVQIAASPDWDASQPLPVSFTRLEQIARQELAKLETDGDSWSVNSFELHSIPSDHGIKWYFVVEMKPFWGAGPQGADQGPDSFSIYVDLAGKAGFVRPTQQR